MSTFEVEAWNPTYTVSNNWSVNYRIDDDTGRSSQLLGSCLRAVHLEDVRGDNHCGVVIDALELKERVTDRCLKTRNQFGHGFLAPTVEKNLASQRGNMVWISNEFLIGGGQGVYGRKLAVFPLASQQSVSVAFPASVLVRCAARFSLSGSEDGRGLWLSGENEAS